MKNQEQNVEINEAEITGEEQLKDQDLDSVAGGLTAQVSASKSKSSASIFCHGPACCAAGGITAY